jgi:hypothetical protein
MADRAVTLTIKAKKPDDPSRFISITKARCIARYRMRSIPGRPEELETTATKQVISFAFAGGELRIRKHGGSDNRTWTETRDFRLRDGWLSEVYEYLDEWIGYISPSDIRAPRPIRDNPQG